MTLPVMLHWKMQGAPQLKKVNGNINALLFACLVNGFNTVTATATTFSSGNGVIDLPPHGFSVSDTVLITSTNEPTLNNKTARILTSSTGQVTVNVPGVPNGNVSGTVTLRFAPLGWTRAFSGTNLGAYRQGGSSSTKRFIRVSDGTLSTDTGSFFVRAYENMTAISTGTVPFPTTTQVTGNGITCYAVTSQPNTELFPWVIIGTPRCFYFIHGYSGAYTLSSEFVKTDTYFNFFGELSRINKPADAFAHLITGTDFPYTPGYLNKATNGTTASIIPTIGGMGGTGFNMNLTYPDPADSSYKFFDSSLIIQTDNYAIRGTIPGLLTMSNSPINAGALLPCAIVTGISGLSSRVMLLHSEGSSGVSSHGALLLDEDWGDT